VDVEVLKLTVSCGREMEEKRQLVDVDIQLLENVWCKVYKYLFIL